MKTLFTSILLLLTLNSFSQNCTDCRYADSLELVKLYNATDGANWTNKWDLTKPMNTWYSAIPMLENGRVTFIDLQQNGLNGTIPNLNLPKLKELFLSDYNLAGSLPNFNLPALQMLFITNSQVSGSLPNFNLPNLNSLAVAGCPFITGAIPAFNNMPNLRQLALSGDQLSGSIPNFTQSFTTLQLGGNLLSGTIPNFSMPNLITLELDGNQLTGSIPNFNLPKLQYLSSGNNQLTGAIPELHLPALLSLNAGYNQLSGALPSFNYLPSLNVLVLSNNQLSGAAPNFSGNSPLYTIDLGNNQLTGSIPAYNLSLLVNLFLGNNQLTGTIPSFQLPKLQGLSLENNQLTGAIPNFNLNKLTALVLNGNQLTGAIPNFNLPELQFLHLNSNQLSGSIPAFNLPYLQSLLLNNNQLTGCIPGAIKINSPSLEHGGDISNNPGLATQTWSDYWDNGAGVCQPPPTASVLTADASSICSGCSTALRVTITGGNSPYTVVYSIGKAPNNTRFTITNYTSGSAIPVSPTANTTYDLLSVTDATSNTGTGNSGAPTVMVTQPTTWYLDADRDKYYISSVLSCTSPGPGYSNKGTPGDCNDNNAAVHPNATEMCDGIDNDCDGQVDEGFPYITYYYDGDGDGYGTPNFWVGAKCQVPDNYVTNNRDCNDSNAAIHPTSSEQTISSCSSYAWNGSTYNVSGDYIYTTTNAAGCDSTATLHLSITKASFLGTDKTVKKCAGSSVNLNASFTTTLTRLWNVANPESITAPGTYRLTATNGAGCKDTAFVTVTDNPKPNLGSDKVVKKCAGSPVNLNSLFTTTLARSWDVTDPESVTAPGTYRLIVTNVQGCKDTALVTVTDNPKPNLGSDKGVTKCPGSSVNLNSLFTTTLTRSWDVTNPESVTAEGTYRLIVSNVQGCKDTAFVTVTNYPKLDIGPDKGVTKCPGSSVNLNSLFTTTLTRSWDVTNPESVTAEGTYRLIVSNVQGCKDTAFVTVIDLKPNLGDDQTVEKCTSSAINLTTLFPATGLSSSWNVSNPQNVTAAGTYRLIVTMAQGGCKDTAFVTVTNSACGIPTGPTTANISSSSAFISWSPVPCVVRYEVIYRQGTTGAYTTVPVTGTSYTITGLSSSTWYQWKLRAVCSVAPFSAGAYTALVNFNTAAAAARSTNKVNTEATASVNGWSASVYPNPAFRNATLQLKGPVKEFTISISNAEGKALWQSSRLNTANVSLPVSNLASGIYLVTIRNGAERKTLKLIIQR